MGESVLVGSVCHERGLCALLGAPLSVASLLACALVFVAVLNCQDDIEAFHPSVFDSCGGSHGGFI